MLQCHANLIQSVLKESPTQRAILPINCTFFSVPDSCRKSYSVQRLNNAVSHVPAEVGLCSIIPASFSTAAST